MRRTALPPAARAELRPTPGQRIWRGILVLLVGLALLLHLAGGWHFSNVLHQDAFQVSPSASARDVAVVAVEGDVVTLHPLVGDDPHLGRPGVFGFEHPSGYLHLTEIVREADGSVSRRFGVVAGAAPEVGDEGDVQSFAFPADPSQAGLEAELVAYQSPLGPMDALHLPGDGSDWVIHVHGKGASPREAFRLMRSLAPEGYHQLAITYRNDEGQPADPSGMYQYGRTEWEDLQGAVRFAVDKGAERVAVVGYSTGAAVALSYLYKTKPDVVRAAVFDSPSIDLDATVDHGAAGRELAFGLPIPVTLSATAKFLTALRDGVNWQAVDYVRRAGQLIVPTLVFHGTDDDTVPLATSQALAAARPHLVTLEVVEGARHVASWNQDPAAYEARVRDFLAEHLR